jgi:hypothetical protein
MGPVAAAAVTVVLWASAFVAIRSAGGHFGLGALALGDAAAMDGFGLSRPTRAGRQRSGRHDDGCPAHGLARLLRHGERVIGPLISPGRRGRRGRKRAPTRRRHIGTVATAAVIDTAVDHVSTREAGCRGRRHLLVLGRRAVCRASWASTPRAGTHRAGRRYGPRSPPPGLWSARPTCRRSCCSWPRPSARYHAPSRKPSTVLMSSGLRA